MTTILSTISGQFSKSLVLGTFFPVVVFGVLAVALLGPMAPGGWGATKLLESLDAQWRIVAFTFGVVTSTAVLYMFNTPILRLFEGYPWSDTWLGVKFKTHLAGELKLLQARHRGLHALIYSLPKPATAEDERTESKLTDRFSKLGIALTTDFPSEDDVLPTRLGNVIRAFEDAPRQQYKIDSIAIWPRLIGVIEKDYAAAVDDSKAYFDFMLNSAVLSFCLSGALLLAGWLHHDALADWGSRVLWFLEIVGLAVLGWWLYYLGIGRARGWGAMVKGAFDLYRWKLLTQMGYGQKPKMVEEERLLWLAISQQMLFGDLPESGPRVNYAAEIVPDRKPDEEGAPLET